MLKVLSNILCDLDPKVKVIGQKAGICDGVPSTSALVQLIFSYSYLEHWTILFKLVQKNLKYKNSLVSFRVQVKQFS